MTNATVQYYGGLKSATGVREQTLSIAPEAPTVADVLAAVIAIHPHLEGAMRGVAVAIGDHLVAKNHPVNEGDIVALLPPVCGG